MKDIVGWIIGIVIIYFVFSWIGGWGKYEGQTAEYWYNAYDEESAHVEDLRNALQEANDNIETANNAIDEAKYSSTFYEMRDAIDNLETVDTVDEP